MNTNPDGVSAMSAEFGPAAWWNRADNGNIRCWTSAHTDALRLAGEIGFQLEPLYDAATVRAMLEGAWCAGYYNAGYTNDSAYAEKQAKAFADALLLPNTNSGTGHVG